LSKHAVARWRKKWREKCAGRQQRVQFKHGRAQLLVVFIAKRAEQARLEDFIFLCI
jgi:hypothetical protein